MAWLSGSGRTAMKRRKWKPGQKALIVLEGLKGRPIGELCAEHEISPILPVARPVARQRRESVRAGRRPPTPGPARTRERAPEEPGRRAHPGAQKKRGDLVVRRGPYAKVAARNAQLLERIRVIKADHPFWGYRRVWAYLRYVDGLTVNQKRIYGIMKATELIVKPNPKLRAKRKADTRKPRPTRPNEWWGIDMTKVMIEDFGWVY